MFIEFVPWHKTTIMCQVILAYKFTKEFKAHYLLEICHFFLLLKLMLHVFDQFCKDLVSASVSMRKPLHDRCLTLEIQQDPGLNGIRTNQCNHAGVGGEMGAKGLSLSACLLELLARLEHQVRFCMEWQTSDCDHMSATLPRGPRRCLTKSSGRSASQTWPRWMWWMPGLTCWGGCTTTR